jgi:uncharacterized protein (DUF427 family)
VKAIWNGVLLAESDDTVVIEGNHYFPSASLRTEYLRQSETHTTCVWKGVASYYDIVVGDQVNKDAAGFYPNPSPAAARIAGRASSRSLITPGPEPSVRRQPRDRSSRRRPQDRRRGTTP